VAFSGLSHACCRYFHSISPPSSGTFENAPWDLGLERPVLVGFYGSIHRHAARAAWHASALAFLKSGNRTSPAHERVYAAPLQDKALHENIHEQFYSSFLAGPAATKDDPVGKSRFEEAWETYATSKFCYQPYVLPRAPRGGGAHALCLFFEGGGRKGGRRIERKAWPWPRMLYAGSSLGAVTCFARSRCVHVQVW